MAATGCQCLHACPRQAPAMTRLRQLAAFRVTCGYGCMMRAPAPLRPCLPTFVCRLLACAHGVSYGRRPLRTD